MKNFKLILEEAANRLFGNKMSLQLKTSIEIVKKVNSRKQLKNKKF